MFCFSSKQKHLGGEVQGSLSNRRAQTLVLIVEQAVAQSPGSEKSLWVQALPHSLRSVILYKLTDLPELQIIQA